MIFVTELVLDALKYAYPDGQGPIRVKLHAEGDARARLSVEDDGVGRSMNGKPPKGLGQAIVRAMASKLNAEWGYDDAHRGTRVTPPSTARPPNGRSRPPHRPAPLGFALGVGHRPRRWQSSGSPLPLPVLWPERF